MIEVHPTAKVSHLADIEQLGWAVRLQRLLAAIPPAERELVFQPFYRALGNEADGSGLGLPIVMTVANRAIGAPINIWNDHSDSMSQRDCGWIQLFAETNQEALDLHIQAFKLGEELSMPVMVCMDGFILTHAVERVEEAMNVVRGL